MTDYRNKEYFKWAIMHLPMLFHRIPGTTVIFYRKMQSLCSRFTGKVRTSLTCCTQTFGCQMNARDSEKLLGILTEIGYVPVETEEADLVLYNTCTVRENANLRVYGRLAT